jgi:hypothetical protein
MQIESVFENLYGRSCWEVKRGYGSFLTMEFGEPHLVVREPRPLPKEKQASPKVRALSASRHIQVRGDWHFWVYCCDWQVFFRNRWIGDSSTRTNIRQAAQFLNGQKLTGFHISSRKCICVFEFDLGGILKTKPYSDKRERWEEREQWMLFEPSGNVLAVRADGHYRYSRADAPEDQQKWQSIR